MSPYPASGLHAALVVVDVGEHNVANRDDPDQVAIVVDHQGAREREASEKGSFYFIGLIF